MLDIGDVRDLVIRPALETLRLWTPAADQLLLGTALKESDGFRKLRQYGGGPAVGLWQMERATFDDLEGRYLLRRPELAERVRMLSHLALFEALAWNLAYACGLARVRYFMVPAPLPALDDIEAQARYWKQHYNTPGGRGTVAEYVETWQRYMDA